MNTPASHAFARGGGANNIAFAMFTFPSLAAYEKYCAASATDPAGGMPRRVHPQRKGRMGV